MIIGGIVGFCLWIALFGWTVLSLKPNESLAPGVLYLYAFALINLGLTVGYLISLVEL